LAAISRQGFASGDARGFLGVSLNEGNGLPWWAVSPPQMLRRCGWLSMTL